MGDSWIRACQRIICLIVILKCACQYDHFTAPEQVGATEGRIKHIEHIWYFWPRFFGALRLSRITANETEQIDKTGKQPKPMSSLKNNSKISSHHDTNRLIKKKIEDTSDVPYI